MYDSNAKKRFQLGQFHVYPKMQLGIAVQSRFDQQLYCAALRFVSSATGSRKHLKYIQGIITRHGSAK